MEADNIRTGAEYENEHLKQGDAFGYADDGEYATVWAVRVWESDSTHDIRISVDYYRCEDEQYEHDCKETFTPSDFDAEYIVGWKNNFALNVAQEIAEADPEAAIEGAREYYEH